MLTKKLKEASANYLKNYLEKERTRPLPTKTQKEIRELIKEIKFEDSIFAEQIVNSKMFNLARVLMKKRGQTTRVKFLKSEVYCLDFSKIFDTMAEITNEGLKKGFFK